MSINREEIQWIISPMAGPRRWPRSGRWRSLIGRIMKTKELRLIFRLKFFISWGSQLKAVAMQFLSCLSFQFMRALQLRHINPRFSSYSGSEAHSVSISRRAVANRFYWWTAFSPNKCNVILQCSNLALSRFICRQIYLFGKCRIHSLFNRWPQSHAEYTGRP